MNEETMEKIWIKRNGDFINGKCFCCKCKIHYRNYKVGCIVAKSNGETIDVDNLEPVCSNCNKKMGKINMNEYMRKKK